MSEYDFEGDVYCADFVGGNKNITYGFDVDDVERLIEKVMELMQAGGIFLPAQNKPDALQIEHNGETLRFLPGAARRLASQSHERSYLLSLTINQEYQRWATRFVPLAVKMDVRQMIEGLPISFAEILLHTDDEEMGVKSTQKSLPNITEALQNHAAFVILGEPGAGKTTTQQKIAFDAACERLKMHRGRIPLFVRLSQQGERDPYSFLQTEWERSVKMPFREALRQGCILILADGINEIPRDKRNERLKDWMLFEQQYRGANQLIFSGRAKDYDNQLNLPRVVVEPLDEERIHEFLRRHNADGLAELLDDQFTRLNEMARNPLNLFVLVMVYLRGGKNLQALSNRGKLFQAFSLELMAHEQLWHPDTLSVDAKVYLFAQLAYEMQKQGIGTTFKIDTARSALPKEAIVMGESVPIDTNLLFRFGRGASILDPATLPDVRFYHHLLQEYFAARELLRRFNIGEDLCALWKVPRTKEEMPPTNMGERDPLPEPPTTGWEVTTILACGLSNDPAKLIEAIRRYNPILAGRCLDEAGLSPRLKGEGEGKCGVKSKVQKDLLADLYNPVLHLRTRLQAGFVLGRIGDLRFEPQELNGVKVILPQVIKVPPAKYLIGSQNCEEDTFEQEYPEHTVDLSAFSIGRWSVTNAEFACFVEAGGYGNETYWQGALAKCWIKGEYTSNRKSKSIIDIWNTVKTLDNVRDFLEQTTNLTPSAVRFYERISKWSEKQLMDDLGKTSTAKSRSHQPWYWKNSAINNPSQPVVGVTWFEASAYCAWLSDVTGSSYRLPTEVEWEAAARGLPIISLTEKMTSRKYPWGHEWDQEKANSAEGRVRKLATVGTYAAADARGAFGAEDQVGNVHEWTSSLYLPYPYDPEKNENAESDAERVIRGGCWADDRRFIRCASRNSSFPDDFGHLLGFRLASSSSAGE